MFYHVIVLIAAAFSAIWGFRRGFMRELPSLIGLAFGIISARLLTPALNEILYGAFPAVHGKVEQVYVYDTVSSTIIFLLVYFIFVAITGFIGRMLQSSDRSILDNIGGSIVCIFKYLFFISIAFNLLLASKKESGLLGLVKSGDGNIASEIMLLSPVLMGTEDAEELAHKIQLEEARKIS